MSLLWGPRHFFGEMTTRFVLSALIGYILTDLAFGEGLTFPFEGRSDLGLTLMLEYNKLLIG